MSQWVSGSVGQWVCESVGHQTRTHLRVRSVPCAPTDPLAVARGHACASRFSPPSPSPGLSLSLSFVRGRLLNRNRNRAQGYARPPSAVRRRGGCGSCVCVDYRDTSDERQRVERREMTRDERREMTRAERCSAEEERGHCPRPAALRACAGVRVSVSAPGPCWTSTSTSARR